MNLSINPLYKCNFRCDFCYLTSEQLSDNKRISLEDLDARLSEVPHIDNIDLYGGEIGIIKSNHYYEYKNIINKYYNGQINLITNMSMIQPYFWDDDISLFVSYDFSAREKHDKVYQNMIQSEKDISVLILASPEVIKMDIDYMIDMLNMCKSVTAVEIKPYSINQANAFNVSHKQYEDFIIKWLNKQDKMHFDFVNRWHIEDSIDGTNNAFSDDHVYITPNGKFGVLEFDNDDKEYFLELSNYKEYLKWADKEKISLSPICMKCKYKGRCLTEHYRYVKDLENSCNGYKGLLEYYERMEN